MERLALKRQDAENTLKTLQDILHEPYSLIVRDAAIQRFEYTFEAIWKYCKLYLETIEGRQALSPKQCFRELFAAGKLTEEDCIQLLTITDHRNETTHTYKNTVAQQIFEKLPEITHRLTQTLAQIKDPQ